VKYCTCIEPCLPAGYCPKKYCTTIKELIHKFEKNICLVRYNYHQYHDTKQATCESSRIEDSVGFTIGSAVCFSIEVSLFCSQLASGPKSS
jgi:hypothetical protein